MLIFYICDRTKCDECHSECKYTSDEAHAKNKGNQMEFEPVGGDLWEVEDGISHL